MKTHPLLVALMLVPGLSYVAHGQGPEPVMAVPSDAEWKWLSPVDGKDPADSVPGFHEKFAAVSFDDATWSAGKDSDADGGGFGYGDPAGVSWPTPESPEHRKTAYLRHVFTTKQPLKDLVLKLQRDDGVVVYLDGKEVARDNVGDGKDAYDLMAEKTISGEGEKTPVELTLSGALAPGRHVLAISLHNRAGGGSDLRIAGITLRGIPAK